MRGTWSVGAVLGFAACATPPYPIITTGSTQVPPQPQAPAECREYTAAVIVGGEPQQATGQACRQPDGRWQIAENTPGWPQQIYTWPPDPAAAALPQSRDDCRDYMES